MASLAGGSRVGTGSTSSLLRSASSLSSSITSYQDSLAAYEYANSAFTDDAFSKYSDYLQGRIGSLSAAGGIANAQKALTLTRTWESATKSNVSASIQRENIQIMSGNATLQDKYGVIANQFQRAVSIGDMTLAQTLESQAYSVSQSIQYQQQQASAAAKTLQEAKVSYQGEVVTSLDNGIKELNGAAKNLSENDFNKYAKDFVDANAENLKKLGVVLPEGAQPNYFNIVEGVAGAKYNALVLKAQAEAPLNPQAAQNFATEAQFLNSGVTKISTLGGSLTLQEVQQAANDPSMFAYDTSTGSYKRTTQTGYQYIDGQVAPTYSGIANKDIANKFYFLSPQETAILTNLGLNFTMNANGTTGDGVEVQASENSPDWLKAVLGKNDVSNFFTDQKGNLTFKSGQSYYTLAANANGLAGLFEHLPDGSTKLAGGDYGFNAGAAQMLINRGQQLQQQIQLAQAQQQNDLKLAAAPSANLSVGTANPPALQVAPQLSAPDLKMAAPTLNAPSPNIQPAVGNIQGGNVPIQGGAVPIQGGGNINLLQGGAGIRL